MVKLTLPRKKPKKLPKEDERPLNKAALVEAYALEREVTLKEAEGDVMTVLEVMARQIVTGRGLSITGFGSFDVVKRPARFARNPQTGERVAVTAVNAPVFRPSQRIKDLINGQLKLARGERIVGKLPKGSSKKAKAAEAAKATDQAKV